MSLVSADAHFLVWSVVVGIVAFGFWSEAHTRLGSNLTGVIVAMTAALVLSNLRVIPFEAEVYDSIFSSILPVAIPLMLFRSDLVEAFRKGGATVVAFCIGSVGVMLGAIIAAFLMPLGDLTAIAAGMYTATYTGGSVNFAATAIATDFNDGPTLTSMIAVDIVATNIQTIVLVGLPGIAFVRRLSGYSKTTDDAVHVEEKTSHADQKQGLNLAGAAFAIAVSLLLVYAGYTTAEAIGNPPLGIIFTTIYALVVSNFMKPVVRVMAHDFDIGLFAIFLFLVALAAGADVSSLLNTGLPFFVFAMIILSVHTLFTLAVGRLFGLDLRSIIIGSTACVSGLTSASAIASAKGWRDLIIPGIFAGTIGTALGTFMGVAVWTVLS